MPRGIARVHGDTGPYLRDTGRHRYTGGPRRVSGRVECDGSASRALDVSHVRHDSCNVAHGSISVAEAVQRADVRPAPERLESGLKTGLFPLD